MEETERATSSISSSDDDIENLALRKHLRKQKRRRIWVPEINRQRKELGEHHRLVSELALQMSRNSKRGNSQNSPLSKALVVIALVSKSRYCDCPIHQYRYALCPYPLHACIVAFPVFIVSEKLPDRICMLCA